MEVVFSQNRKFVLFLHKNTKEYKILSEFPAFIRIEQYYGCEAIQPIVYNVIQRFNRSFKSVIISPSVQRWLDEPFKLKTLPEDFKFITKPINFQEIALRFLYTLGSAGLLLDPGMGKSKIVLDYISLKKFNKSVIVCPAALLFVWEDEIRHHRNDLSYHIIKSTDWENEYDSVLENQVTIINYNKAVILKHRLKEIPYDFIHLDEFLIKNPTTDRTKALTEIGRGIPHRAGGSGTLINNSPLDAFCPSRFLQPSLVGWNYSYFFKKYTVVKPTKATEDKPSRNVVVAFRGKDEIRSILESCCIVMTKEEWLKLPEKHFHDIYVQMDVEQKEVFYKLMRNYYVQLETGKEIKVDNPLSMLSKLYQISQGFIYTYKEPVSEINSDLLAENIPAKKLKSDRETYFFGKQPKIEALKELIEKTLAGKKSIIWFNLDGEHALITNLLNSINASYLSIKGGDVKIGEKVRKFNKDPTISYLVCQSKSVNYGITVLGSSKEDLENEGIEVMPGIDTSVYTQIFYSINFSLEVYLQQIDRTHRLGQKNECNYYRIFVNNPIESKLREAISLKMNLKKEMLIDVANSILLEEQC